jgi:hypothetical protein
MSQPRIETLALMYKITARRTLDVAQALAPEKRLRQLAPGKAHPTWLLGHLAYAYDTVVAGMVLGLPGELPPDQVRLFSPHFFDGAEILPDAARYPAWEELLGRYKAQAKRVHAAISALRDDELTGPIRGDAPERIKSHFSTIDIALGFFATHDAYHCGQIALIANLP